MRKKGWLDDDNQFGYAFLLIYIRQHKAVQQKCLEREADRWNKRGCRQIEG